MSKSNRIKTGEIEKPEACKNLDIISWVVVILKLKDAIEQNNWKYFEFFTKVLDVYKHNPECVKALKQIFDEYTKGEKEEEGKND